MSDYETTVIGSEKMSERVEITVMTPDRARALLELNTGNFRKSDISRVSRYAADMAKSRWDFTGDSIKLNGNVLMDGQHRLLACVKSGASFKTTIVYGVKNALNIDRGKPRTVGQWIAHEGIKNANSVASISRKALAHSLGLWGMRAWHSGLMTDAQIVDFVKSHESAIQSAHHIASKQSILHRSTLGAVVLIGSGCQLPEENYTARWFCERLAKGDELSGFEPVLQLRNRMSDRNKNAGGNSSEFLQRMLLSKAWNMTVMGEQCKLLRFNLSGPTPSKAIDSILVAEETGECDE